jgi:HSP20 family protein
MLATRWQPFNGLWSEVSRLQREMDQLASQWGTSRSGRVARPAFPPLNVWEDQNNLHVEAELPGLCLDDLEIYVNGDNQLIIKGERKQPELGEAAWHRQERGYGEFSRLVELPEQVEAEKVSANFKHGVLVVTLPKREEVKPRRITIQGE